MATKATTQLKLRTGISDAHLDSRIDEDKLWELSGLLGSYELYVRRPGFGLNESDIADLRDCAKDNNHQYAMSEAFRKWSNVTSAFTYRLLVEILIKLRKRTVAEAVCRTVVGTVPSETVPSETVPSETVPSETVPSETVPSETVPSETVPSETVPSETVPSETVSSEPVPSETVPSETASGNSASKGTTLLPKNLGALLVGVCLLLIVLVVTWQHKDSGLTITLLISSDQSKPGSSVDIHTKTVSHNLPRRSSPFFGRENNITNLTKLLLKQNRIININGPPAFGKSSLAIKLGWHLIENYSTVFKEVRYIDTATTKRSIYLCSNYQSEQSWLKQNTVKSVITLNDKESQAPHESNVEPNLCEWFKTRKEITLLILDNCDSVLQERRERQEFFNLINSQLDRCDVVHNKLSIVITSQERLEFPDDCFQSLQITELDPADSVSMLQHHVPALNDEMAHNFSSLVGHCPLALKVVGRMLAARGMENMETVLHSLEEKIVSTISNRISDTKERFKAIMDLAYTNLDIESQECSLIVSFFPSTFERTIGNKILSGIVDSECVATITQKSFVEEYFIASKTRYTMHKLIRSYFKEERSKNSFYELNQEPFSGNFITCYSNYLVKILKDRYKFKNITDEEVHKIFYLENENLKYFEHLTGNNNLTDESVLALSLLIIENISCLKGEDFVFSHLVEDYSLYIQLCQFSSTDICSRLLWRLYFSKLMKYGIKKIQQGMTPFYRQLVSFIDNNNQMINFCKNLAFLTYGDTFSRISKHVEQSGSNEEKDLLSLIEHFVFFCKNDWIVHSMRLAQSMLVLPAFFLLLVLTIMWLNVWFSFKESASIAKKHFLFFWFLYWLDDAHLQKLNTFIDIGKDVPHKVIEDSITIVYSITIVTFLFTLNFFKIVRLYKRVFVLCFTNILIPTVLYVSSSRMHLYCFHLVTSLGLHVLWKYVAQHNETVREETVDTLPYYKIKISVILTILLILVKLIMMFYSPYYVIQALSWFSGSPISMFDIEST